MLPYCPCIIVNKCYFVKCELVNCVGMWELYVGYWSRYKGKPFQLCWCWLHCLHQYGYHTTVTVTCTASLSKLCINIRRRVNCEILCNISKSQDHGNQQVRKLWILCWLCCFLSIDLIRADHAWNGCDGGKPSGNNNNYYCGTGAKYEFIECEFRGSRFN